MRYSLYLLALLVAIASISCNRRAYVADNFEERTADHLSIAVIPFDVLNTGRRTKRMTEEFMEQQRAWEAEAFQQDLVDRIMRRATRNRRLVVDMQATTQTNILLADAGISLVDAHDYTAAELTKILGVDAVVMASVQKNKVLTDVESAAVSVLTAVLNAPDAGLNRTYEIDMRVTVLDKMGATLYNDASRIEIDFISTPDEAISRVNNRLIRKFPYIEKVKQKL
ncbi:MAG: hypothetical protein AB8F78_03825 [Saprospiraceae bacterium]